jgi:hypothetical protein
MEVQSQHGQTVRQTLSQKKKKKTHHKKGLVDWLKVKTLSSSPSTAKSKAKKQDCNHAEAGKEMEQEPW